MYYAPSTTHFDRWRLVVPLATDEQSLIQAARCGDVDAFNQLALAHQPRLYTTAYYLLGDSAAAADATQEALIAAYRRLRTFNGGSFKSWLHRIVTRKCYDQLRDVHRRRSTSWDALAEAQEARWASKEEPPEGTVQRRELARRLEAGLEALPFQDREMVVLRDVQELSYTEIAAATQRPVGTVKSKLSRARAKLRGELGPHLAALV